MRQSMIACPQGGIWYKLPPVLLRLIRSIEFDLVEMAACRLTNRADMRENDTERTTVEHSLNIALTALIWYSNQRSDTGG